MNILGVIYHVHSTERDPPQGLANSVILSVDTKSVDVLENPTTGRQTLTGRSTQVSQSILIPFTLRDLSHDHIHSRIHNQLTSQPWLCVVLASVISTEAINAGFGRNGFTLTIVFEIIYETVVVMSNDDASSKRADMLRMIRLGRVGRKQLKSLKLETEPCSICLENLSDSKPDSCVTRMTCSHVFHDRCLLEWLERKNTCPLCRTVVYEL